MQTVDTLLVNVYLNEMIRMFSYLEKNAPASLHWPYRSIATGLGKSVVVETQQSEKYTFTWNFFFFFVYLLGAIQTPLALDETLSILQKIRDDLFEAIKVFLRQKLLDDIIMKQARAIAEGREKNDSMWQDLSRSDC